MIKITLSCSELDYRQIQNSFVFYKKITTQYRDERVLRDVKKLIPGEIRDDLVLLLKWFKGFMRWMPKELVCNICNASNTLAKGNQFMKVTNLPGTSSSVRRIESHTCIKCGNTQLFPRYDDVLEISKTRIGRCSEWSVLFGAILNSVSLETRLVHDYLDHCWNEVSLDGKWVHADPTFDYPDSFNNPYFYERNWKKQYSYIIAFTPDKIEDVTQKYTEQWDDVITRRQGLGKSLLYPSTITDLENLYNEIRIS